MKHIPNNGYSHKNYGRQLDAQKLFFKPKQAQDFGQDAITRVIVVSDLHMSEGRRPDTVYWDRLENFTVDDEFHEFLRTKAAPTHKKSLLVINGDFVDFLRVTRMPESEEDFCDWRQILMNIPESMLHERQKQQALADFDRFAGNWKKYVNHRKWWHAFLLWPKTRRAILKEKRYGLGTEDFKSVYRLWLVYQGHRQVFKALAEWLKAGHSVAIFVGNHDPEFDQGLVQAWLRYLLETLANLPSPDISKKLQFFRNGVDLWDRIRIEHGHRYEWHTKTYDEWLDRQNQKILLPAGSLFNRYFVNHIEFVVPYLDNVRPNTRVIYYLLRSSPLEALRILPTLGKAIGMLLWKKGARRLILLGAIRSATFMLPAVYLTWLVFFKGWQIELLFILKTAAPAGLLTWVFHLIAKKMRPHFAEEEVRKRITEAKSPLPNGEQRFAICGHTHRPDVQNWLPESTTYFNSGTWTLVFEYVNDIVRDDLTKTFVELNQANDGKWQARLLRWAPNKEKEIILMEPRKKRASREEKEARNGKSWPGDEVEREGDTALTEAGLQNTPILH